MKNLLITRDKERSNDLAKTLETQGFRVFFEPLFNVRKIFDNSLISLKKNEVSAVILTSINAIDSLNKIGFKKDIKVFSVGKKSFEALKMAGFSNVVISKKMSANSLKDMILEDLEVKKGKILYLHGSIITLDFKRELQEFGLDVENILVYETKAKEEFSDWLIDFKSSFSYILIFSANSAKIFYDLAKRHNMLEYFNEAKILCFSSNILKEVKELGFRDCADFTEIPNLSDFYE